MSKYINGEVPSRHLFKVGGEPGRLNYSARTAFDRAKKAAKKDRVAVHILNVRDEAGAYRPRSVAISLRQHPALYDVNPKVQLAPAPDDSHGQGTCFDVSTAAAREWLIKNGPKYHIHHPLAGDPNHFEYIHP